MLQPEIAIKHLSVAYAKKNVLQNIDLTIQKGEFVGIVGPNGSGKSTLIKTISAFLPPTFGKIEIQGKDTQKIKRVEMAKTLAVVPQNIEIHFPYRVYDFVAMGRHPYQTIFSLAEDKDEKAEVEKALEITDTKKLQNRSVMQLSGGEQQRVILAAALVQNAGILLLDEPTSSFDLHYQIETFNTLKKLNQKQNLTILAVTHDLNIGSLFCDRLVFISNGHLVADGSPEEIVTNEMIEKYYGINVDHGISESSGKPFIVPTGKVKQ